MNATDTEKNVHQTMKLARGSDSVDGAAAAEGGLKTVPKLTDKELVAEREVHETMKLAQDKEVTLSPRALNLQQEAELIDEVKKAERSSYIQNYARRWGLGGRQEGN